jgi:thiosulfate dehydrogenase [quinone] large subunit
VYGDGGQVALFLNGLKPDFQQLNPFDLGQCFPGQWVRLSMTESNGCFSTSVDTPFRRGNAMTEPTFERAYIVFFRLAMGWTFLYAASHQVFVPDWSVVGFLSHTKTFHDLFAAFTTPTMAPVTTFLVEYGHLLIGLSLVSGLMVRVSASFGILLMIVYWMAHMDFPFIENKNSLLLDFHIVYVGVLGYLIAKKAGHVWGLDAWVEKLPVLAQHPKLRPLFA